MLDFLNQLIAMKFFVLVSLHVLGLSMDLKVRESIQRVTRTDSSGKKAIRHRITAVENKLMPAIQFADSAYQHFGIYDRMKTYDVPSVSIAVINNGKIEWAKAYGLADIASAKKATTQTVYQSASISKSINAVSIMRLVREGKLSLDTNIRHYLKTWQLPENEYSTGRKITLKNLLSHTAGMSVGGFNGYSPSDSMPVINQILTGQRPANSEAIKPIGYPGFRFQYSGGGTVITRKIIEDVTKSSYAQVVSRTVLDPLQMNRSSYAQSLPTTWLDVATAYGNDYKQIPGKYTLNPELAPDGLWTTPTDLAKFILAIQQAINGSRNSFLDSNSVSVMLTPVLDSTNAALGFFIANKGSETYFQHAGSNVGYRSNFYGSVKKGRGVVVMINCDQYDIIPEIINSVAITYGWKDFYQPELRRLVTVSDTVLNQYVGAYSLEEPRMHFTIKKMMGQLYLASGTDSPERMYFTSASRFFLLSSKQLVWEFAHDSASNTYQLTIKQGSDLFITRRSK